MLSSIHTGLRYNIITREEYMSLFLNHKEMFAYSGEAHA